jgi:urease accessory protein UreH
MDHELRLNVDGRLSYLERYRLVPSERSIQHQWRTGLRDYTGTMLVHHEAAGPALAESLQQHMSAIDGVAAGVDLIEPSLLVRRLLGEEGVAWSRARARFRELVLASAFQSRALVFRR